MRKAFNIDTIVDEEFQILKVRRHSSKVGDELIASIQKAERML